MSGPSYAEQQINAKRVLRRIHNVQTPEASKAAYDLLVEALYVLRTTGSDSDAVVAAESAGLWGEDVKCLTCGEEWVDGASFRCPSCDSTPADGHVIVPPESTQILRIPDFSSPPFEASMSFTSASVDWFLEQMGWDASNEASREKVEGAIYAVVEEDKCEVRSRVDDCIFTVLSDA